MVRRPFLSRERIVGAAAQVADRDGLGAVSMRNVGKQLGVEAMSLYHHVASKDDLLDALADWIFTQIEVPPPSQPWRPAMQERATSLRRALAGHSWALNLTESRRTPGTALLRHHEAVLACLRGNGFSVALASHAFSAIDAYVYGFVLTEQKLPFEPGEGAGAFAAGLALPQHDYPHLSEMMAELVIGRPYRFADEFGYGLTLILDGLAERLSGQGA